jgi:putative ABC transport system permease protein
VVIPALTRKLLRDLTRMWAQVLTIALVVACGVATFITFFGAYRTLRWSERDYYEQQRFADVFARCVRARAISSRSSPRSPAWRRSRRVSSST